ncbi:MAG TPA: hypothetical protein VFQ39_15030, partial [Longimicrobium sp.]|nr:hypothetical protein [Longimicrobium sp.]
DSLRSTAKADAGASGGCDPARGVALAARVDATAEPHRMAGELRFADCPSCSPVPFTAARVAATSQEGR